MDVHVVERLQLQELKEQSSSRPSVVRVFGQLLVRHFGLHTINAIVNVNIVPSRKLHTRTRSHTLSSMALRRTFITLTVCGCHLWLSAGTLVLDAAERASFLSAVP